MHSVGTDPGLRGDRRHYSPIYCLLSIDILLYGLEGQTDVFGISAGACVVSLLKNFEVEYSTERLGNRADDLVLALPFMKLYLGPFPGCETAGE
jgi:hypothetical protein